MKCLNGLINLWDGVDIRLRSGYDVRVRSLMRSKVMTSTEFKALHNLSATQFRTIRDKVLRDNPKLTADDIIQRKNSTDWVMFHIEEWEKHLPNVKRVADEPKQSRWSSAIVPTVDVEVQDESTGEWLDIYREQTNTNIERSQNVFTESVDALQYMSSAIQSIRESTRKAENQAMNDELNEYRLRARYKSLMKAKIDADEANTPFLAQNELNRIAKQLGVLEV